MRSRNIIRILLVTTSILLLPLVAMQFTEEVGWEAPDFVFAGTLFIGTGLAYELATRLRNNLAYRAAIGLALLSALALIWINLAVGLIGSEDNPANLLYIGVLATGVIGAVISRLRPSGMARTLFTMAIEQALVPAIALIIWQPRVASVEEFLGLIGVLLLNAFFVVLFVGSGLLFLRSSTSDSERD